VENSSVPAIHELKVCMRMFRIDMHALTQFRRSTWLPCVARKRIKNTEKKKEKKSKMLLRRNIGSAAALVQASCGHTMGQRRRHLHQSELAASYSRSRSRSHSHSSSSRNQFWSAAAALLAVGASLGAAGKSHVVHGDDEDESVAADIIYDVDFDDAPLYDENDVDFSSDGVLDATAEAALSVLDEIDESKDEVDDSPTWRAGKRIDGLRDYRLEEVAAHTDPSHSLWVMYREGVFDVTEFLPEHPGGDKLLLAAGSRIDPFWALYLNHFEEHVHERLEKYRIGNVHPDDVAPEGDADENDPYRDDPRSERSPVLRVRSPKPFCAEPPEQMLLENWFIATELHYIRNHLPVPAVTADDYTLTIEVDMRDELGDEEAPPRKQLVFTLDELKDNFPRFEVEATLQVCLTTKEKEKGRGGAN
jgi:cytochrome b involved in lipid metabolism